MSRSHGAERRRFAAVPRPTQFGWICTLLLLGLVTTNGRLPGKDGSLVALVAATLGVAWLVGAVWPVVAVRLARFEVVDAPLDGTVGGHIPVDVRLVGGAGAATSLRIGGLATEVRGRLVDGSTEHQVVGMAGITRLRVPTPRRGMVDRVAGWIETEAPVGMFRCRRPITFELPAPVAVGPVPIAAQVRLTDVPDAGVDRTSSRSRDVGDTVRSVRPYRLGDPAHLVHWPTSARTGELVVLELEPPSRPGLVLVVEIRDESPEAEDAVAEAAGIALAVLGAGGSVLLCTNEGGHRSGAIGIEAVGIEAVGIEAVDPAGGRQVRAEVRRPLDVARRLAAAVPGPVGEPPANAAGSWPVTRVAR